MPTTHTVATVVNGENSVDVAVPIGTTVSGVLASLGRNHAHLAVTDEMGRPLGARETFGQSLGAGAVIVIGSEVTTQALPSSNSRGLSARLPLGALAALAVLLALSPVVALTPALDLIVRVALAATLLGATARLLLPLANRARWQLLLAPAAAAAAFAAVVPHPPLIAGWSYALVFLWAGCGLAMLIRVFVNDEAVGVAAMTWLVPAALTTLISIFRLEPQVAGPLVLAASMLLLGFVPTSAVRVPESQTLHLPAVLNTAQSVHAPEVAEPAAITPRRVRHTMRLAVALQNALISLACLGVVASAGMMSSLLTGGTIESWSALALLTLAVIHFSLQPRQAHSAYARWAPRVVVVVLVGIVIASAPFGVSWWWFAAIVIACGVTIGFGVWIQRSMYAPFLTRLGDIAERASLALVVPAFLVAAGSFSMLRSMS